MATLIVPDESKFPKEQLLLGDVTLTIADCNGQPVTVHGLTANDLMVKTIGGDSIDLIPFIQQYAGGEISNKIVSMADGSTTTVKAMADSLSEVEFTIADLEQKYNNI